MAFKFLCPLDELWEGEMEARELEGQEVLLVWPTDGELIAYQPLCPHQEVALIDGKFDGKTLICRAHNWVFDACTGKGINPGDCELTKFPLRIEGDKVLVDLDVEVRKFTHT
jgi:toluene monooxygenase system ferredoxin subunit